MRFEDACRSLALRRRIDWTGRYLRLGGEAVHYVEAGQGEPVLLVHGFLAWSFTWRKNLPALAERFRAFAPDLPGFGLSQRGPAGRYGLDHQADLLARFLDAVGIGRAALIGHSMGGEIALRFALRHPDRLKGMVLVAPSALVRRRKRPAERWLLPLPVLGPLAVRAALMNRRFAARTVREAYYRPEQVTQADIEGYLLPAAVPGSARTLAAMLRQLDFGAAASRLPEIPHRTLLIWGADDPWVPVQHSEQIAARMQRCQLVIFPECGHVPHEEHPERFHQVVIPFLGSL